MNNKQPALVIAKYIHKHPLMVLSTVNADAQPHGAAIYIAATHDLTLYFATKQATSKHAQLGVNPAVALTSVQEATQTTLQIHGVAAEIEDPEEALAAYTAIQAVKRPENAGGRLPLSRIQGSGYAVYSVNVINATLTSYDEKISKVSYSNNT